AGGAFLAVGGPKRVFRRAKRAITGKEEDLPSELLPKDIEKALKTMGTDGRKVRGTLERDFAKYLDERQKERRQEGIVNALTALAWPPPAGGSRGPLALRGGGRRGGRMLDPTQPSFNEQRAKTRARRNAETAVRPPTATSSGAPKDAGL